MSSPTFERSSNASLVLENEALANETLGVEATGRMPGSALARSDLGTESAASPATQQAHESAILRTLETMRARLTEEIDLEDLAEQAVMSSFHFLRVFRELTGVPPVHFLAALRVEAAKRLLIESDEPVLEICHAVGYSSLGSFSTRFTKTVGLSPGRFRQLGRSFFRDLDSMLEVVSSCPLPDDCGVLETSIERRPDDRVLFAGLFDTPIPQGRPLSCAVLLDEDSDEIRLAAPPVEAAFLFAVAMSSSSRPIEILIGGDAVSSVAAAGPLDLRSEPLPSVDRLYLHPRNPFNPPMLLALPLLLHEKAAELGHVDDVEDA